jgi:hypothetical protein
MYRGPESFSLAGGISSTDLDAPLRHLSSELTSIFVSTVKLTGTIFIGWKTLLAIVCKRNVD